MANAHHLQLINEIAGCLSSGECRRLSYLCGSVDTDSSVTGVREMLQAQLMRCQMDELFLLELMFALRRFDILRKVMGTSRDEVERTLGQRHVLSKYRVLMADVSEDIANEDLKNVKFLLSGALPRDKMDKAKNFLDVVVELEKLDKVSPERLDFVEQCLRNIGRIDLAKKINVYQRTGGAAQQQPLVHHQIIPQKLQRSRAPFPSPTSNCSYLLHQPRHAQPHPIDNFPVSVRRKQNCQSPLDCYKMNDDPRGVCVIIDCVGSDGDMLEDMFKGLHFTVVLHKWLGVGDTLSTLRGVFRQRENQEAGAFVCCLISRGTASHLLATDTHSDGLRLEAVRQLFTAEVCPLLAGKPKVFFIQRYSVPELQTSAAMIYRDEDLETDGRDGLSTRECVPRDGDRLSTRECVPTDADVFWSHCWTDERQLGQGHHRSVYLQALTEALHKGQRRKTHLVDIHTEVNRMIYDHNKRNPGATYHIDLKHTLRKNLYLQ